MVVKLKARTSARVGQGAVKGLVAACCGKAFSGMHPHAEVHIKACSINACCITQQCCDSS